MRHIIFSRIILFIIISVLVGAGGVYILTGQVLPAAVRPLNTTPSAKLSPNPAPNQPPQTDDTLSVVDLTGNKEFYLGKRVRVRGRVVVNVFDGDRPCPANDITCDTTSGARLELWQPNVVANAQNFVLPFKDKLPHPCLKTSPAIYKCPPYVHDQITIIEGVWRKIRVPTHWAGSSDGSPPKPIKWDDKYILSIE